MITKNILSGIAHIFNFPDIRNVEQNICNFEQNIRIFEQNIRNFEQNIRNFKQIFVISNKYS